MERAEYCDDRACVCLRLCVCRRAYLRNYAFNVNVNASVEFKVALHEQVRCRGTLQYQKLQSVTQLDIMCIIVRIVYVRFGRGSVLLWQRCDKLCVFGFMYTFIRNECRNIQNQVKHKM